MDEERLMFFSLFVVADFALSIASLCKSITLEKFSPIIISANGCYIASIAMDELAIFVTK